MRFDTPIPLPGNDWDKRFAAWLRNVGLDKSSYTPINSFDLLYTPGDAGDWVDPDPTTVEEALDKLADRPHSYTAAIPSDTRPDPATAKAGSLIYVSDIGGIQYLDTTAVPQAWQTLDVVTLTGATQLRLTVNDQTFLADTWAAVQFDNEIADPLQLWDAANFKIVVPTFTNGLVAKSVGVIANLAVGNNFNQNRSFGLALREIGSDDPDAVDPTDARMVPTIVSMIGQRANVGVAAVQLTLPGAEVSGGEEFELIFWAESPGGTTGDTLEIIGNAMSWMIVRLEVGL